MVSKQRALFGTDGVRGPVDGFLTSELVAALAAAATEVLGSEHPRVLVLRDTRESGPELEQAVASGVKAAGGKALLAGVLPTPAAPLLIKRYGFDLGVVISASHNPYADNGIKFFQADGYKLDDAIEAEIELRLAQSDIQIELSPSAGETLHGALEDYLRELESRFSGLDLSGLKVGLDCANGATYQAAPEIFRRLGAEVTVFADRPDGRNINAGCGSTHVEGFGETVVANGLDLGFSFDGDGDRMLAVDRNGVVVDGDELIAIAAIHMRDRGALTDGGVAVTVMTNFGFHTAMEAAGIAVTTTSVGDRYVLEELRNRGWLLGGEQSGHIIQMDFVPSGDGIASALLTLEALAGKDLAARDAMQRLPQLLINVAVNDRDGLMSSTLLEESIAKEQSSLKGRGRVLVRPSGTEQLIRVMVEAPTENEATATCERIVQVVKQLEETS